MRLHQRKAIAVAAVAAVAGTGIAGAVGSSAGAASKPPVKILVAAAGASTAFPHPGDWAGAKAAAIRINKRGGINGQRIEIVTCNDNADRNATTACARTAVAQKAIAVIGPSESFVQDALPVLSDARTAFMGGGASTNEQVSRNSFPLTGGAYTAFGAPVIYFRDKLKIKDIAIVTTATDVGFAAAKTIEKVIKAAGLNDKGTVGFPLTTQDFAPVAAQLKSTGAKGVLMITGGVLTPSLIQAANQIGFKPAWAASTVGVPPATTQKYKDVLGGMYLGSSNPPVTANIPAMKQFRKDMATAKAQGVPDTAAADDAVLGAWLMVGGLQSVAKKYIKGTVTAAKMLAALRKGKNIDPRASASGARAARGSRTRRRSSAASASWTRSTAAATTSSSPRRGSTSSRPRRR
jgi:ABC-type branched-subunit amino acid transport system substrate-binding protein